MPRDRLLRELHFLRDTAQDLHHRLDRLISEFDTESATDPRVSERAREIISELREGPAKKSSSRRGPSPGGR